MSYDLIGLRVPPGLDPQTWYDTNEDEDERAPTPEDRAEMERLAAARARADPALERYDGEDVIELSAEAIQVSLYAREASITVPYWYDGGEADAALARVMGYARVLADAGGYTIFDPQTGRLADLDAARAKYVSGREVVRDLERPRRRWWRRR